MQTPNENVDFTTTGTSITFTQDSTNTNTYTATYTASEEGYYKLYAENNTGKTTNDIYLGKIYSITILNLDEYGKINDASGRVKFALTDAAYKITEVGIVKKSDLTNENDFEEIRSKAEKFQFTPSKTPDFEYPVTENSTFIIYAIDEENYTYTYSGLTVKVEDDVSHINISIQQDETDRTKFTITATDDAYNITEIKVKKGENVSEEDLKSNGESLTITPGKTVNVDYTITESCTLNVYAKDSNNNENYTSIKVTITQIDNPITFESVKDESASEFTINITVNDTKSNIKTLKYATGDHTTDYKTYFANNGTVLTITEGKTVNYAFKPTESGYYTFYAKDENNNESVHLLDVKITEIDPPVVDDLAIDVTGIPTTWTRDEATLTLKITPGEAAPSSLSFNGQTITLTNGVGTFKVYKNGEYTITLTDSTGKDVSKTFSISTIYKLGDIDDSGEIDLKDILLLRRHVASLKTSNHSEWTLTGKALASANIDCDENGTISLSDVLKLRRYVAASKSASIAEKYPSWLEL